MKRFAGITFKLLAAFAAVGAVTFMGLQLVPVNATTVGFTYLLLILLVATNWGFPIAAVASLAATLCFNFFFLPPLGTLTIADPQNWVALFSLLLTSLIAGRLSSKAEQRALDALEHQHDLERLYTFSRSILLIDSSLEPFAKQLARKLAEVFEMTSTVLYDRPSGEIYRAGPSDFEGMDEQIRDAAIHGMSFSDPEKNRVITAVKLGSEPIASLALQGPRMPDAVLQGLSNLVAIGLERARTQDLAHQIEASRQSEQLRATLIDAMAHEFMTPLTSVKAATSSLLANPDQPLESRKELLMIADEEAEHLRELIDDSIEMARLDVPQIDIQPDLVEVGALVREVVTGMQTEIDHRPVEIASDGLVQAACDQRLMRLAIKQLLNNALKYSPLDKVITLRVSRVGDTAQIDIHDQGPGIPDHEQKRIFERFYRSSSVKRQIPGSGLGLSIAKAIVQAHKGDISVTSSPGDTTFRITLPVDNSLNGA